MLYSNTEASTIFKGLGIDVYDAHCSDINHTLHQDTSTLSNRMSSFILKSNKNPDDCMDQASNLSLSSSSIRAFSGALTFPGAIRSY